VGLFFFYLAYENRSVRDSDVSGKSKQCGEPTSIRESLSSARLAGRDREDNGGFTHLWRTRHSYRANGAVRISTNNFDFSLARLTPIRRAKSLPPGSRWNGKTHCEGADPKPAPAQP